MCVSHPYTAAGVSFIVGVAFLNSAFNQDKLAGDNLASSLVDLFRAQIPSACLNKSYDTDVLKCFRQNSTIVISPNQSENAFHDFQEYQKQFRGAYHTQLVAFGLFIFSAFTVLFSCATGAAGAVRHRP